MKDKSVIIIDTSSIKDIADYGGMLYALEKMRINDGKEFQIDNAGDLLMYCHVYSKCSHILKNFKVKILG